MKKIITIFITFFCLALILPANTKAAKRNANDITKLKKITIIHGIKTAGLNQFHGIIVILLEILKSLHLIN